MIRRIAATLAALIATVVISAPSAQACEPKHHHGHTVVQPTSPVVSPARFIDWD